MPRPAWPGWNPDYILSVQSTWWGKPPKSPPSYAPVHVMFNFCQRSAAVASPGFVVRRGKDGKYVLGHSQWTSGPGAAAARWLIVLWLMQYWSKELWVGDICTSWSRRLHNTWKLAVRFNLKWTKIKLLEVEGSRAPVPHGWRRHCSADR